MRDGLTIAAVVGLACATASVCVAQPGPTEEQLAKVRAALPEKAYAQPEKPRRLLIFTLCRGFKHSVIPLGAEALRLAGEKTGAYSSTVSDDIALFDPDKLAEFDGVCFMNTTGELFLPADADQLAPQQRSEAERRDAHLKQNLLHFVKAGKGLIGVHAATDCFYRWTEFGEMMGGYFDGHPWNEEVTIKLDEPKHVLTAMFEGQPLVVADEIYQFKEPYSRQNLRVLMSLDTNRTNMKKDGIKRKDGDFAVTWVREFGRGRVFYCSLGHRDDIFWNPKVLRHYLAGIQFALGDLKANATPIAPQPGGPEVPPGDTNAQAGWTPLFNGKDLTGWKGLVGDPKKRAALSPDELAKAQDAADELMRAHWKVEDGVLVFDGSPQGSHLCTARDYRDFEMKVDWKIGKGGDSGIYLRGCPQVQIWDAAEHPEGSGGLYNNERSGKNPLVRADRPAGEWNTFHIRMVGQRVTVRLNDQLVVDNVPLENMWEREKPVYSTGPIELQSHGSPLWFRNLVIRELPLQ